MMQINNTRSLFATLGAAVLVLLASSFLWQTSYADDEPDAAAGQAEAPPYVPKTKAQLRRVLTPMQFKVTQSEGTEPAFQNAYWNNKLPGTYHCIVCDMPVFDSTTMFDSGTGWPSFYAPLRPDVVGYKNDRHYFVRRIEVHCKRCGAHFGHVFDDGPAPTGKRYCMNSASLKFYDRKTDGEASTPSEAP